MGNEPSRPELYGVRSRNQPRRVNSEELQSMGSQNERRIHMARRPLPGVLNSTFDVVTRQILVERDHVGIGAKTCVNSGQSRCGNNCQTFQRRDPSGLWGKMDAAVFICVLIFLMTLPLGRVILITLSNENPADRLVCLVNNAYIPVWCIHRLHRTKCQQEQKDRNRQTPKQTVVGSHFENKCNP